MQSANQILHQLEAANAATQAANGGVNNTIVSGYSSSSGSMSPLQNSADSMSSMDEYSTSMDFSDLANEEALDAGKGDGAAGGYGKANYEASGGKGANEVLEGSGVALMQGQGVGGRAGVSAKTVWGSRRRG